jgi:hypothetical protein
MKLELIGYPIIKNKVSPMLPTRSQTESPHPTLSRKVERVDEGKRFNGTPHFYSLPQGERKDGRKNFKRPLTLTLSSGVEREDEGKRI